jgi:hypothetical protein
VDYTVCCRMFKCSDNVMKFFSSVICIVTDMHSLSDGIYEWQA